MVRTLPSNADGSGSIPGRGAKIPHASRPKNQNIKQKQYCNKFNKTLKMVHIKKKIVKKELSERRSAPGVRTEAPRATEEGLSHRTGTQKPGPLVSNTTEGFSPFLSCF